jgi:subtilisin family serine protease
VGATQESEAIARFSQQNDFVDLAAPGIPINTTVMNGGYGQTAGTSFSAGFVTGAIGALQSNCPSCSNVQTEQCLFATARDLGVPGRDVQYGFGVVNPVGAYQCLVDTIKCCTTPAPTPPAPVPTTCRATGAMCRRSTQCCSGRCASRRCA